MIKTHKIQIQPNKTMLNHIEDLFNYRRYVWNQGLALWNDMYESSLFFEDDSLRPNGRKVRNELVRLKHDWQYNLSSRVLQTTIKELEKAWKNFFNPKMTKHARPAFKSRKAGQCTFTTDRATIIDGKLLLDKPQSIPKNDWFSIKLLEPVRFEGTVKTVTITEKANKLYASIAVDTTHTVTTSELNDICGIDVNVKRFNYNDGQVEQIVPNKLNKLYDRIAYLDKVLSKKRCKNPQYKTSNRYQIAKNKRRKAYNDVYNIQMDILQKFTTKLVNQYYEIHIEDLNVEAMKMSSIKSKNLHRSMFGKFRTVLTYKCEWNDRKLIVVNRFYPSTQTCSQCGYIKTKDSYGGKQTLSGDSIYHDHQTYRCYECEAIMDRDENAVQNLINYSE